MGLPAASPIVLIMSKSKKNPSPPGFLTGPQRLNKILAAAGLGARRQVEELIEQGRVEVDGKVCNEFHLKVDPSTSKITVDGQTLKKQRAVYFALNKPAGVLCTNRDPHGRTRAIDLVPDAARLFPVGRLDRNSIGLILLTNDGELAQRLAHPKYGVAKSYFVVVQGHLSSEQLARLRRGIYLAEGVARVEGAKIRRVRKGCTELEITLTEGKNREIRRVLARLGHKVMLLRRLAIGPLRLADLGIGMHRPLTQSEVAALYLAADEARRSKKRKSERSGSEANDSEPGSKELAPKPSRAKPIQKALPKQAIESEFASEDDEDGDDFFFADPNSAMPMHGMLDDGDEEEEEAIEGDAMVEVSPHWGDSDAPLSKRRGGIIDYEGDEVEDSEGDYLDPFEDAGILPDEDPDDIEETDAAGPNRGRSRTSPRSGRPRNEGERSIDSHRRPGAKKSGGRPFSPRNREGNARSDDAPMRSPNSRNRPSGNRPTGNRSSGPSGTGNRRTGGTASRPIGKRSDGTRSSNPRGSAGKGTGTRSGTGKGPATKGGGGKGGTGKRFVKGGSSAAPRDGGARRASGPGPRGRGGKKGGPRGGKGPKR